MTSTSRARGGAAGPASGPGAAGAGTGGGQLRLAIIGLLSFAAAEEEMLLASVRGDSTQPTASLAGSAQRWAAAPVVAHNTEFKRQQVQRLAAIRLGQVPPEFTEIDHRSAAAYRRYRDQPDDLVTSNCRETTIALLDAVSGTPDADLLDPARHAWLRGRQLALQVIVRGFWHPTGHVADYYLEHGSAGRAVALQQHAVATAEYAGAPAAAIGMACYSLACAQARAGQLSAAAGALRRATQLNGDLAGKAISEPDLAELRAAGLAG